MRARILTYKVVCFECGAAFDTEDREIAKIGLCSKHGDSSE